MSLLGWVVGAALLDEWDHREEEERESFCELILRTPKTSSRLARNAPGLRVNSIMPSLSLSFSSRLMHLARLRTRRCLKSSVRRTDTRECEKRFGKHCHKTMLG